MTWHKARSISSGLSPQLLTNSGLYTSPQKPQPQPPSASASPQLQAPHSPSHAPQPPSIPLHGQGPPHAGPNPAQPSAHQGYTEPQRQQQGLPTLHPQQGAVGPNPFYAVASMPVNPSSPQQQQQQQSGVGFGPSTSQAQSSANPSNLLPGGQAVPPHLPAPLAVSQQGSALSDHSTFSLSGSTGIHSDKSNSGREEDVQNASSSQIGSANPRQEASASQGGYTNPDLANEYVTQPPLYPGSIGSARNLSNSPSREAAPPGQDTTAPREGASDQFTTQLELPEGVTERPQLGRLSPPTRNYSFLAPGGMKSEPSSHKLSALEGRNAAGVPVTADEAFNEALKVILLL